MVNKRKRTWYCIRNSLNPQSPCTYAMGIDSIEPQSCVDTQTDREKDRQTDTITDRQTERQQDDKVRIRHVDNGGACRKILGKEKWEGKEKKDKN